MKSLRICMQNIRKWSSNSRIKMCLVLAILFVYVYTKGLGIYSASIGEDMSPWIFPFLFGYRYMKIVFMLPIIFIFCDAPFVDANQTYVMLRTDRKTWSMGQVLYIVAGSFLYSAVLLIASIVCNIGHMQWMTTWGKALGSASTGTGIRQLGLQYTTTAVSGSIIRYYTPLQAMVCSFIIMWLSFIFIGLVMYVVNVFTRTRFMGAFAVGFLVLLTAVVDAYPYITWISPVSWNSLNNIDIAGMTTYPTIQFAVGVYMIFIIVFAVLAVVLGRKQEIIVQEEK